MPDPSNEHAPHGRLATLLQLLKSDPNNLALLSDAAETALAENDPATARTLLERYAANFALPPREMGLAGLAAMRLRDFSEAEALFARLLRDNPTDAALRFNLAWTRAALKDSDGALELLDPQTTDALPQAAMLQVQLLHASGHFDEAFAQAKAHIARHPDHSGLLAAVSVLATDMEDPTLAQECAQRAGGHPDALTTLGMLALTEDRSSDASDLFDRALQQNDQGARAWVGSGLVKLLAGAPLPASRDIQHGAELFRDHVGSWIAAGWAHILANDLAAGRACFERALALDHNFSESHGSLAVLSLMEGHVDDARRSAQTATRLDRQSFSGALANAMLLSSAGKPEAARMLIERALHTPIDASGRTIAQSLVRYGLSL